MLRRIIHKKSFLNKGLEANNIHPVVSHGYDCEICLFWLHGQYNTYTDYKTSIIGIIEK